MDEKGSRVISREHIGWEHFKSDYISSAWLNPDGTRVLYCIPLDIDAKGTDKKWLDEEGRINWEKAVAHFQNEHSGLLRNLKFVVRSTGGKGIHLGIAVSPVIKDGSDGSIKTLFLALQAQVALIRLLKSEGLGADMSATGVIRDLPNWRRHETSIYSQAKQLYYNKDIHAEIKRENRNVITDILAITNKLKQCRPAAKKDQEEVLHPHKTTEAKLAHLYIDLFDNLGQTKCFTMAELKDLTGISTATLRNLLIKRPKSRPRWLNVNYLSRTEGYELWLNPEYGDIERALKLIENPEYASTFLADLKMPEEVIDGERNLWLSSAAIHYKWHGYSKHDTLIALNAHSKLIPRHEESRSCRNLAQIVESIYRNQQQLFGIRKSLELPIGIREKSEIKKSVEGPLKGSGFGCSQTDVELTHYSIAFTRRGNEKMVLLIENGFIISSQPVFGTGYEKQLGAIQKLLKDLDRRAGKLTVKGQSMFKGVPVAKKFAKYHGFEFAFEERSAEDKRILKEFRQDHHSPESANVINGFDQTIHRLRDSSNNASLCTGFNSYVVANGEIKEVRHKAHSSRKNGKQVYCVDMESILSGNFNWILGLVEKPGKGSNPIPRENGLYPYILPRSKEYQIDWPKEDFVFPEMAIKKVRCDGYVAYLDNYYWLGDSWIGRKLQVVDDGANVEFYLKGQFIREYKRLSGKGAKTPGGTNSQWHKAKALDSTYRRKAQKVGPAFDGLILAQIERGKGIINTNVIFQFLRLMDSWPYEQLEAVAKYCLKRRNYSYRFFNSCLEAGVE